MRTPEEFKQHVNSLLVDYEPAINMHTYSFRAECVPDAVTFINRVVLKRQFLTSLFIQTDPRIQEPVVQFQSNIGLEELREILRGIRDSYVMLETLRAIPLSQNKCERDSSIN